MQSIRLYGQLSQWSKPWTIKPGRTVAVNVTNVLTCRLVNSFHTCAAHGLLFIFSFKNNIYRSEHLIRSTLREDLPSFVLALFTQFIIWVLWISRCMCTLAFANLKQNVQIKVVSPMQFGVGGGKTMHKRLVIMVMVRGFLLNFHSRIRGAFHKAIAESTCQQFITLFNTWCGQIDVSQVALSCVQQSLSFTYTHSILCGTSFYASSVKGDPSGLATTFWQNPLCNISNGRID